MAYIDGQEILFSSQINMTGEGGGAYVVIDDKLSDTSIYPVQNKVIKGAIDGLSNRITDLETQISDMLFKPISITSFTHDKGIQEIGSTVTSVTFTWVTNKTPVSLTLEGLGINVGYTSAKFTELSITDNKTWTLVATDEKGNRAVKTTTITFCNGIYYGVGDVEKDFTSEFVVGLNKVLQDVREYDFTVSPNNCYIYYAIPKSRGAVAFKVGGFEGGFEKPEIVSVTNASGYTEDYYVYRSTNKLSGSVSIDVV